MICCWNSLILPISVVRESSCFQSTLDDIDEIQVSQEIGFSYRHLFQIFDDKNFQLTNLPSIAKKWYAVIGMWRFLSWSLSTKLSDNNQWLLSSLLEQRDIRRRWQACGTMIALLGHRSSYQNKSAISEIDTAPESNATYNPDISYLSALRFSKVDKRWT